MRGRRSLVAVLGWVHTLPAGRVYGVGGVHKARLMVLPASPLQRNVIEYYAIGSVISLLFCIMVMFLYLRYKANQRHPTNLLFWRVVCDTMIGILHILAYALNVQEKYALCSSWCKVLLPFAHLSR